MRLLVVEDQEDCAFLLAKRLQMQGHEVRVCNNACSALLDAPVFEPDAVLLDIGLPGMDGWQLAPLLRDCLADRPVKLPAHKPQAELLFLATIALLIPSAVSQADSAASTFTQQLSAGLAVLLMVTYGLSLLFSLKTHRELFAGDEHADAGEPTWPLGLALGTLAGVTALVALVSEVFVDSVQKAAQSLGLTPAFVGFVVVALVGAAAEMTSAFCAARKNRLDLSVGIALGSASQIALFVAPALVLLSYAVSPSPMNLQFWPGAVVMILIAAMTAALVTNSGRSTWFLGVMVLMVYLIFAMTLYLLPPEARERVGRSNGRRRQSARYESAVGRRGHPRPSS